MSSLLSAPWFYWAVGLAVGLPLLLVALTEWQNSLRRRGSALLRPVTLLRNFLLPLAALLVMMIGATQMPAGSTPVRIVGTLVAFVVLVLLLSGLKASLFAGAPDDSWRRRIPGIFVDVIRFALIALGVGLILAYIWGAHIGGLFTALGIGSIVIGLTLQNSVGQIISGLLMLFEQPFRIGDWIELSDAKGRVIEVNWRAVHVDTGSGIRITPNSVLAGQSFVNLSRPVDKHVVTVKTIFGVEDRPDQVCSMLARVASSLPQRDPGRKPSADHVGAMHYSIDIPLRSANDDWAARTTFFRWIWYAARREGLHLDEADDFFSDPDVLAAAVSSVVSPILRLDRDQEAAVAIESSIEVYGAGELIQAEGIVPEAVSFIVAGEVLVTVEGQGGARTEVDTLREGSYLGQSTLIRHPAIGAAYARDEVTLVRVPRDTMEKAVESNPVLLQEFGRAIDERRQTALHALQDGAPAG